MKLIKVIFRPEKTIELKDALTKSGYHGITFKTNLGFGEQRKKIKQSSGRNRCENRDRNMCTSNTFHQG